MSERRTNDEFIAESKNLYPNRYDYTLTNYIKNNQKVQIKCIEHNHLFEQTPANHKYFEGCPICFAANQREKFVKSTSGFIKDSIKKHGNIYDYSKTDYQDILHKVLITCKKHGDFEQHPTNHLKGCGCPKCGIEKLPGSYSWGFFTKNPDKKYIKALLYNIKFNDIYKIGITTKSIKTRYTGLKIPYTILWEKEMPLCDAWATEQLLLQIYKDYQIDPQIKFGGKGECLSIDIPKESVIHIFFDEWTNKKDIVLSRFNIKNHLQCIKIPARKCEVKQVLSKEANDFLRQTHIQGSSNSSISLGLYNSNKLVSIMTFGKPRFSKTADWELIRYSTELDTIVQGGASKLFKTFITQYNPKNIVSYSDKRWNIGEIYHILGFKYTHTSSPNYWYTKEDSTISRVQAQKHKLPKLLDNFDPKQTEYQNMMNNGFQKIVDNGNDVYLWSS